MEPAAPTNGADSVTVGQQHFHCASGECFRATDGLPSIRGGGKTRFVARCLCVDYSDASSLDMRPLGRWRTSVNGLNPCAGATERPRNGSMEKHSFGGRRKAAHCLWLGGILRVSDQGARSAFSRWVPPFCRRPAPVWAASGSSVVSQRGNLWRPVWLGCLTLGLRILPVLSVSLGALWATGLTFDRLV